MSISFEKQYRLTQVDVGISLLLMSCDPQNDFHRMRSWHVLKSITRVTPRAATTPTQRLLIDRRSRRLWLIKACPRARRVCGGVTGYLSRLPNSSQMCSMGFRSGQTGRPSMGCRLACSVVLLKFNPGPCCMNGSSSGVNA